MHSPGTLPPGLRIYAVGDVHGCATRLRALHGAIRADLHAAPVERATLIHLGDLIDRGPDSAGVIAMLLDPEPIAGIAERVNLMGNHEAIMLDALRHAATPEDVRHWLVNGGDAGLRSWGVDPLAAASASTTIPQTHVTFIEGLAPMHRAGGYVFVHAGVRPGVPLDRQSPHDLMWIRKPFLDYAGDFGATVVHGHTPVRVPDVRSNRINVDTGAVMGGPLTCVVLEGDKLRFLTA